MAYSPILAPMLAPAGHLVKVFEFCKINLYLPLRPVGNIYIIAVVKFSDSASVFKISTVLSEILWIFRKPEEKFSASTIISFMKFHITEI